MKCLRKSFVERIVCDAMEGRLTTRQAAAKLGCTRQYLNKLKKRYMEAGGKALLRRSRLQDGRRSRGEPRLVAQPRECRLQRTHRPRFHRLHRENLERGDRLRRGQGKEKALHPGRLPPRLQGNRRKGIRGLRPGEGCFAQVRHELRSLRPLA